MIVFCIPAGGTNPFPSWSLRLNKEHKVVVLDIPGRGRKYRETPISDISDLASHMVDEMFQINSQNEDYLIFGYCFGAILAYEMCRCISKRTLKEPKYFISFGIESPDSKGFIADEQDKTESVEFQLMVSQFFTKDTLGNEDNAINAREKYIAAYKRRFGTDCQVQFEDVFLATSEEDDFEKNQLLNLLNNSMIQIEQDDAMLRSYQSKTNSFDIINTNAIIAFGSDDVFVDKEKVYGWSKLFNHTDFLEVAGDHYSIVKNPTEFIDVLNKI